MKRLRFVLITAVVATAMGLPSATADATTTNSAAQYLGDVGPLNAAVTKWIAESDKWTKATTSTEIRAQTSPYDAALHAFQKRIHDQKWPKRAARAVAALYTSITALESTVSTLEKSSPAFDQVYVNVVQGQDSTSASKANPVRHDLGLPPLEKSTYQEINHRF